MYPLKFVCLIVDQDIFFKTVIWYILGTANLHILNISHMVDLRWENNNDKYRIVWYECKQLNKGGVMGIFVLITVNY